MLMRLILVYKRNWMSKEDEEAILKGDKVNLRRVLALEDKRNGEELC